MAVEDEFPRFSPYEEVRYDDRVKLLAWCPKRELLAILFAKGMAAIARGSSKKFSIFPRGEGSISALAWRPDGRVVALGYTTGLVELRDVESSGELVHAFQETHAEITCISWVAESDLSQGTFESRKRDNGPGIMDALPELSTIPNSTNRPLYGSYVTAAKALDVMVVGDALGDFHLSIYGILHLGGGSLRQYGMNQAQIRRILMSPDLSAMSMIAESMDPSSNLSGFWLTALDPVLLFSRKSELRLLAWRSTHVDFLLHYLGDGLRALKSDHNTLVAYDRDLEETFRAAAENHNVPPNAEANFIAMLGSGKPSTGLEQFMMQTLRRSGIDKWQQVVINTYASMSRLIFVYVMPALEQLIMHLGDLIGLTRWYEHLGVAGLNERDVELVVCLAESLVDDLQKLSSAVDRDSKHFQKFIVWLRAAYDFVAGESSAGDVDQLSTVDTVDVSSYIRESLFKDPLSAYFAGEAAIGGLAGVGIDRFGENGVEPLESRMQDLTERCKRIFDAPARAIGTSIQLTGCVRMTDFPAKPDNHGDAETALRSVIPSLYHCQEKSSVAHYAIFYLDAAFDIDNSASLWVLRHRKSAAGRRGFVVAQTENPAAIKWEGEIARFPVLPMLGELQDPELVDVDFLSVQSLIWLIRSRDVDSGTEESNLFTSRIDNLLFLPISTHGVVQKSIQSEIIRQQGEPFVPEAHFAGRLEKSNASFMEVNLTTANVMLGILEGNGSRLRLLEETPDEDDEDEVVDDGDEEEEEA